MNADGPLRQTVESGGRRVEQERHLVDKGPRTAGAIAVHAHVRRFAFQENDFGVLAADVDEGRRLRMVTPDIGPSKPRPPERKGSACAPRCPARPNR